MADIIDTLHPEGKPDDNIYPNVKKDNIPGGSIDFNKLSPEVVQAINRGPQVVNTEAYILALSSDQGMAVGTDTGKWYYWNGTQYVEGGVYLANFGLYYKIMTSSDLTLSSGIIENGGVAHNTYTIIEASLSNSLLSAVTSDDYTINVDLGALSAALNLGLPSSSIVYLTKTTDEVGSFSYEDVSMDPFSATMHKFSAIANGERITLKFFHLYETADNKYLVVIEKGESLEVYTVDESCIFYGTTLLDFRIAIAAGSTALAAGMTPVLHQIIDGVEQEENLIKLVPSDSRVINGASIFVDNNGAVCFGTAGSSGGVTENTEVSICKVSLPEGSYQYKLTVRFDIIVGAAYFGCGLKTIEATASDSALIQVSHQFSSSVAATATENATATLTSTRNSRWSLKPEFTDILDRRNSVLAIKAGLISDSFGDLNLYYYFTVSGKGADVLDSTWVFLKAFMYTGFTFGDQATMVLTRVNDIYTVFNIIHFNLLTYGYEYPYDSGTGEEIPGGLYSYDGDLRNNLFETTNKVTENSTKLISSGGTYKAIEDSKKHYTKDLEYFDEEIFVGNFQKLQLKELGGMSYKSENLYNHTAETMTYGGITYTISSDGTVTINGTSTTTIMIITQANLPAGTYTWALFNASTCYNSSLSPLDDNLRMELRDGGVIASSQVFFDNTNKTKTFTTTSTATSIYIRIGSGVTITNFTFKPMLVSGSTAPTEWSEGFSGIKDNAVAKVISKGANLVNVQNNSVTDNDISYVASNEAQSLKLNGTSSGGSYKNFDVTTIPSGTYYVTVLISGTVSTSCNLYLMSPDIQSGAQIGTTANPLSNQQVTFSTDVKYLRVNVTASGVSFNNLEIKVMVSKTSITEYKPYRGIIDTLTIYTAIQNLTGYGWGINDTCYNYIDFDRKVFVQKVGRIDMGTMTYSYDSFNVFRTYNLQTTLKKVGLMLCEKYKYGTQGEGTTTNMTMAVYSNTSIPFFHNENYTDATNFKTAMSGVYLYYELATPIETDISAYLDTNTISVEYQGTIELEDNNENSCKVPLTFNYITEKPLLEDIVDALGRPRFIEGNGVGLSQTGVTITQCKWSLSGTHLMCMVSGSIANTTVLANNAHLATFDVPSYIFDKIEPVWLTNIEAKSVDMYAQDWTKQQAFIKFMKGTSKLTITCGATVTFTASRNFRIQFDYLVDTD